MKGQVLRSLKRALIERFLPELQKGTAIHAFTFDQGLKNSAIFEVENDSTLQDVKGFIEDVQPIGDQTYAWSSLRSVLEMATEAADENPGWLVEVVLYTGRPRHGTARTEH